MTKKIIAWALAIVLVVSISIAGTVAYLTDRDSKANVFTVGDVNISLKEDFAQGSELIPGVNIEKSPSVENNGKNAAYVWATVTVPEGLASVIDIAKNTDAWTWSEAVDGVYTVKSKAPLAAGAETAPLFTTVALNSKVDIAPDGKWYTVENGTATELGWTDDNGNPVIYVSAYAMQTEGIADVDAAIVAYGEQWGDKGAAYSAKPELIYDGKGLHTVTATGGSYILVGDITTSEGGDDARYGYGYEYIFRKGGTYTLDLNGCTINHDTVNANANKNAFTYTIVANNAGTQLTIKGDGKVVAHNSEGYTCAVQGKDGTLITINGGDFEAINGITVWAGAGAHIVINDGTFVNSGATTSHELIYSSGGVIDIYGGFFHNEDGNYTLNIEDRNRATGFINVYGGTFVNFDPSTGSQDPNNIKVAEGYTVISETQANGDVWYTVVKA